MNKNLNRGKKQMTRPDDAILDHIRQSLWTVEMISSIDFHDISVSVENGQVVLSGHVSKDYNARRIEEITRSIPGVNAIHNHLVTDSDLKSEVIFALQKNENTRMLKLPVSSHRGWVEVGGFVPTKELQNTVEATTASVAAVRGVLLLPSIKGKIIFQKRDAIQPGIGVHVVDEDGTEGSVCQVIVNPQNRLVIHAVVRVEQITDDSQVLCDYLIPVEALFMVGTGSIYLSCIAPGIHQFPGFTSSDFPFAPLTWQPPYPYSVGSVRWPRLEKVKAEQRSTENSEILIKNSFGYQPAWKMQK